MRTQTGDEPPDPIFDYLCGLCRCRAAEILRLTKRVARLERELAEEVAAGEKPCVKPSPPS